MSEQFTEGPEVQPDDAPWQPANDAERRLRIAVEAGDAAAAVETLATAPLFLPAFQEEPAEDGHQRVIFREWEGVTYLLVFTSPEAVSQTVSCDGWRPTTLARLVRHLPSGFGVAVNPAGPIGMLVPPQEVPTLVRAPARVADFEPANLVERLLRDAIGEAEYGVVLDALVTAQVITPVRPLEVDGAVTVPVFTSPGLAERFLAGVDVPTVAVDLVEVVRRWPGPECRLVVNPGTAIELSFTGDRVPHLLDYASVLVDRDLRNRPLTPVEQPEVRSAPQVSGAVVDLLRED